MAVEIGTVVALVGEVKAIDSQGNERILLLGDIVYQGEEIVTSPSASITI